MALESVIENEVYKVPVSLETEFDGGKVRLNWTVEYLAGEDVFYFHDGGNYFFDAGSGAYLGTKLSKKRRPKRLSGTALEKFPQMFQVLSSSLFKFGSMDKSIVDKVKFFNRYFNEIKMTYSDYVDRAEYDNVCRSVKSWRLLHDLGVVGVYKGCDSRGNVHYGFRLKGSLFDNRKRKIIPLIFSDNHDYKKVDIENKLKDLFGDNSSDFIPDNRFLSNVCLEEIVSHFKKSVKDSSGELFKCMKSFYDKGLEFYDNYGMKGNEGLEVYADVFSGNLGKVFKDIVKTLAMVNRIKVEKPVTEEQKYRLVVDELKKIFSRSNDSFQFA